MPCAGAVVWSTAHQAYPGADLGFAGQPPLRTGFASGRNSAGRLPMG
jgi:hypothetical protein